MDVVFQHMTDHPTIIWLQSYGLLVQDTDALQSQSL